MSKAILFILILVLSNLLFVNTKVFGENYKNENVNWTNPYFSPNNNPVFSLIYNEISSNKTFILSDKNLSDKISSKIVTYHNTAYFVTDKGNLFMVDLDQLEYNKTQITKTGSLNTPSPVIAQKCNVLIVKDSEGYINYFQIISNFNLKLLKRYGSTGDKLGIIATETDVFFTASAGPAGEIFRTSCYGSILNIWLLSNYIYPSITPSYYNKVFVIQTTSGSFIARSIDKTIEWDKNLGIISFEPLTINNNYIFAKGKDFKNIPLIMAINLSNGNKIWSITLNSEVISNIISINEEIIFLLANNTLIRLNLKDSKVIDKISFLNYNIKLIKTDLIYINNILIFLATKNNNYVVVYYDIVSNNILTERIVNKIGDLIGLSLAGGKLIVTGRNGFEILPIYTRSSLTIDTNPKIALKVKIDEKIYTINGTIKLYYLIHEEKIINIQIQSEITINRTTKMRLSGWENAIEVNYNNSIAKLTQWNNVSVVAKYDYFLLSRLEINYEFLNYTGNIKPKITINYKETSVWEDFIRKDSYVSLKLFAESIIPINSTDSLIFSKWSDNVTVNERNYDIKSYSFIKLTAYYILSKKAILKIKIITTNYTYIDKITANVKSSYLLKFENDTAQIVLDKYKTIDIQILNPVIYIDKYHRYKFIGWQIEENYNNTYLKYLINKNYNEIIILFKYERKYELYVNKLVLFNNKIVINNSTKIYEEWSDNYLNYSLRIKKIEYLEKDIKIEYKDIIINENIISNKTMNNDELIFNLKLFDQKTNITIYYKIYKLTKLTLIINNNILEKINLNYTQLPLEKTNNSATLYIEKWLYEPINLIIDLPKEIKINEVKTLRFTEFKNISKNSTLNIKIEPGEEVLLEAIYTEDNKEINSQFIIGLFLTTLLILAIILVVRTFR